MSVRFGRHSLTHVAGIALLGALALAGAASSSAQEAAMKKGDASMHSGARVCRWYGGRQAALSLRFDDSHPTQIQNALPLLNEYGCIGTFLVNPGNPGYQQNRSVWEGALLAAGHELGDHTLNHNGALTDRDAEKQIGEAAEVIRRADPTRSQLLVFLGGGGTQWMQRKPIDFFTAKYHLLRPRGGGSMSCREDVGWKPSDFVTRLDEAITNGEWMQAHFHCVGPGYLPISVASFRQVLEAVRAHRAELWQTGMNSIAKYVDERDHSIVWARARDDDEVALDLVCEVDTALYRQPLTLELDLPSGVEGVVVRDGAGTVIQSRVEEGPGGRVVRFDATPSDATFVVTAGGLGAFYRQNYGPDRRAGALPYLFFGSADLPALREKMNQPFTADIWRRIRSNADELTAGSAAEWKASGSDWDVKTLAFAYAMTGERTYADRGWLELEALMKDERWRRPKAEALRTAEAAGTMGMAYDWMYNALSEDQRRQVREVMIQDSILPIVKDAEQREWYTTWSRCNWGGVIFGQVGVAALSLLDDDPRAADWARLCREKGWHYTQSLGREGGWGEGGSYGEYIYTQRPM
ncbi:MAG: polysaccharide deacetylase family protein [Armatimonadota bacterium]